MIRTNLTIALGITLSAILLVLAGSLWGPVAADDDQRERRDHYRVSGDDDDDDDRRGSRSLQLRPEIPPASLSLYQEECGACHLAYPPALLPAASWERMLGSLDDHFGENAELDGQTLAELRTYLLAESADRTYAWLARKMQRGSNSDAAPLRITELPYFRHEHDEIPMRLVKDNPKVGSFSRCEACHQDAAQGMFDEHKVHIAGFGRWDD